MRAYERKVNQLKDLIIRKYKSAYDKSKEMDIDISSMTYLPEPDVFNVMYTEHMSVILDRVNKIIDENKDKLKNPTCATCVHLHDQEWAKRYGKVWVSERHINGIGYGSLLPTVQTQGLKVCDKDGKTRLMDLSSLPKQGIKYGDLLPTPVASDHTGSCTIRKMTKSNGAPRTDSLRNMPAVIGMDGDRLNGRVFQLSPLFVEEMMGYPLMWTTLPFLTGNGEKNQ